MMALQRTAHSGDLAHLTIEDGISRSFDKSVRNQLRSMWNKVSKKTKQLVTDLGAELTSWRWLALNLSDRMLHMVLNAD